MPPTRTHAPGSFVWIELLTTDQPAASRFYTRLFGWTADHVPISANEVYTIFNLRGDRAAAAFTLAATERDRGIPPHWGLYVSVPNADVAASRVQSLGGRVIAAPFDVMDLGRMAVVADPSGAILQLWEARRNPGLGVVNEPGALCWADLNTPDRDRIERFYTELFGWTIGKEDEEPAHGYWHIRNGDAYIGGIPPAAHLDPHTPPHWLIYFQVADCDASAAEAARLGARLFMPPTTFEHVGRMAVMADPQGAAFAIFQPGPQAI